MLQRTLRLVLQHGVAVVAIAVAALIARLLDTSLGTVQIALLYAAVAVAVWHGGPVPALLATALGGVAVTVVLPGNGGPSQLSRLLGYLLTCSILVALGHALRVARRRSSTELAARRSEARYRALVEATARVVWTWSPGSGQGEYDKVQAWWQELTGQTPEEQSGTGWLAFVHPDDHEQASAAWLTAMTAGSAYDTEYRVRTRTGEYRHLLSRAVPIHEPGVAVREWVGMMADITEHKRVEDALKEADRRKDEFLATLAHELRNPLAPIRSALQLLKMPAADPAAHERAREMMERQLQHLVRLVDDLLDVSRIMRGKIDLRTDVVALETVIARALESAQHLIDAQRHILVVSLPAEPVTLNADPVRLAQVVGNLLANAAKYTEPGGRIRLAVERSDGDVLIRVRDTGIGIAPEMQTRIFEPFVQVDHSTARAQGGLGIGLTLVKSLVEMHHGSVEAHSAGLGQGSELIVRLPAGPAPEPAAPAPGPEDEIHAGAGAEADHRDEIGAEVPVEQPPAAGGRILVVDDNTDAGETLAMLLGLYGHQVEAVGSGMAALELIPSFRPDMVFLDIGMPVMDGYEVARRLREQPAGAEVYLVALTGWGQPEDRRRTREAGFDHHLIKPVDPGAVRELIAQVLERLRADDSGGN